MKWLNVYKQLLSPLDDIKEWILKIPDTNHRSIGFNKDNIKETIVSFIRWFCVFL